MHKEEKCQCPVCQSGSLPSEGVLSFLEGLFSKLDSSESEVKLNMDNMSRSGSLSNGKKTPEELSAIMEAIFRSATSEELPPSEEVAVETPRSSSPLSATEVVLLDKADFDKVLAENASFRNMVKMQQETINDNAGLISRQAGLIKDHFREKAIILEHHEELMEEIDSKDSLLMILGVDESHLDDIGSVTLGTILELMHKD